jgi:arginyl-tRNA synthetase
MVARVVSGRGAPMPEPRLPEYGTHIIPQFAFQLARVFSSYYGKVKILSNDPAMYTRVRFCRAVQQVINNALALFLIEPLEAM